MKVYIAVFQLCIFSSLIFSNIVDGDVLYPRIANFYGSNIKAGMSKKELDFLARYSLIVSGFDKDVTGELSYLKSKNPNLIVLHYISVRGMSKDEKGMRPELWLNAPRGQPVSPWKDRYLPNQTLPEVNNLIVAKARELLTQIPQVDGIFLDSYSNTITYLNNGQLDADGDGIKDDPQKINNAWAEGLLRIARGIRAIKPNIIIMANGWDPLDFAYDELNGVLYEDQMVRMEGINSGKRKGPSTIADDLLKAYQKWQTVPNVPRIIAFVDGGSSMEDSWEWAKLADKKRSELINSAKNNTRRMRLNLCFALMGDGYAAFDYGTVARGQKWWFPEWDIELGKPLGAMQKFDGYWRRQYEYAIVYANPYPKEVKVKYGDSDFLLPPFDGKIIIQ